MIVQRGPAFFTLLCLLAAGAIQAVSYAPGPLPAWLLGPVQIITMAFLVACVWRSENSRQAFWRAWIYGLGGFVVGLYWLTISMHHYGGMPLGMAVIALVFLSAYLAIFPGMAACVARTVNKHSHAPLAHVLAWASAWTLGEWLRSTLFTGFPWMAIGYAHVDGWLASWASIFGVYGVHFIAAFIAACLAMLFSPKHFQHHRLQRVVTAMVGVLFCVAGISIKHIEWSSPVGQALNVRIVQGNVEQGAKFLTSQVMPSIRHHLQLARLPGHHARSSNLSAPNSPPAREGSSQRTSPSVMPFTPIGESPGETVGGKNRTHLILLPETVIPVFQYQLDPSVWEAWKQLAAHTDSVIMMGAPLHDRASHAYTNSVIRMDPASDAIPSAAPQPGQRYDKHHLVPFGEFIPWGFRWFVNMMAIPLGDFDRGAKQQQPFQVADQRVAPNICYEDVFGEELLPALRPGPGGQPGATILANFSNLGWFGDTWALRQHWQMARVRAIETARPMLRATNTGISGAIGVHGETLGQLPSARSGVLDLSIQGRDGLTPYTRAGNLPILLICLATLAWCLIRARRSG